MVPKQLLVNLLFISDEIIEIGLMRPELYGTEKQADLLIKLLKKRNKLILEMQSMGGWRLKERNVK